MERSLLRAVVVAIGVVISIPGHCETLVWNPNPESDIAGYRVFYGRVNLTPTMIDVGNVTSHNFSDLLNGVSYYFYLTAYNSSGLESDPSEILSYTKAWATSYAKIFYNNSAWDGNNPAPNALDDAAIASDKRPLLPGQIASFANYTTFHHGINGLMVDIVGGLGGVPSSSDFQFRVGNGANLLTWSIAPPPSSITVRPGAGVGGSDRITIIWPDGAIRNQWLEVRVLANSITRLPSPKVFYFGNAIGDSGNSSLNAQVDVSDENLARENPRNWLNPAAIDDPYDYNRDKRVDISDENLARIHTSNFLTALKLIDLSLVVALSANGDRPDLNLTVGFAQDGSLWLETVGPNLSAVRIQASTDLSPGSWEDAPSGVQNLTAESPLIWTLLPDKTTDRRFFRAVRD